jgi:phosphoribosylaminoimidazole-succinocarboxamide synthase
MSNLKLIKTGKTKDVYQAENGNISLKFKDDVTGADGVFDPGANTVGLSIDGAGKAGLKMTTYFFELLSKSGIKTHFVSSDIENNTMEVLPCKTFGNGIEIICRFKATGSFIRRYGAYVKDGATLDSFVEVTLKDDERNDPPITKDALAILGILNEKEYEALKEQTVKICKIIKSELSKFDCELYDIKLEFGRNNNQVMLIDEVSGGNMRVFKNGKSVTPIELSRLITK